MIAPQGDDPPNPVDRQGDSPPTQTERELRAWRRTIEHLTERGLTPIGVPTDVAAALDAFSDPFGDTLSDDHLRRILELRGES
jgi:hypothetical protein